MAVLPIAFRHDKGDVGRGMLARTGQHFVGGHALGRDTGAGQAVSGHALQRHFHELTDLRFRLAARQAHMQGIGHAFTIVFWTSIETGSAVHCLAMQGNSIPTKTISTVNAGISALDETHEVGSDDRRHG